MKLSPEQMHRFNLLIWAFDAATLFKHDTVTDVKAIIAFARLARLTGIANDLEDIINLNNL